jgi:hypothetical protein
MSDDARAAAERLAEYYDFMGTIEGQERDALVVARHYLAVVADRDRLAGEVERLRAALVAGAEMIGDGFHRSGGTDETSWDVCDRCGAADWDGHKKGCRMAAVIADIRAALATRKDGE